ANIVMILLQWQLHKALRERAAELELAPPEPWNLGKGTLIAGFVLAAINVAYLISWFVGIRSWGGGIWWTGWGTGLAVVNLLYMAAAVNGASETAPSHSISWMARPMRSGMVVVILAVCAACFALGLWGLGFKGRHLVFVAFPTIAGCAI